MGQAVKIEIPEDDREVIERWERARSSTVGLIERCRIVLLAAEGMTNAAIARKLSKKFPVSTTTVSRWRRRYAEQGLAGIEEDDVRAKRERREARAALDAEIVRRTTQERPPNGKRWSVRAMAEAAGTTPGIVQRVWKQEGLKPHLAPPWSERTPDGA